uniref:t-SNARE coiled-coil homology domain-containing protein n=1 Tax=Brassica oleracea var. oleracea TaxID=109376 RepID=A0A0D3BIP9_BRAOL
MSSAQDPFYIVKEEIQDSIDKLQSTFHKWERVSPGMGDQVHVTKELLANCGSIEWQCKLESFSMAIEAVFTDRKVDELEKAVAVAAKDPALYGIDEAELERRRRWTSNARTQVRNVKTGVLAGKGSAGAGNASEVRRELMRMPNSSGASRYDQYGGRDDDGFVHSESDRQMLLIKQQDEELDELSKSVERIGGVGLTIHDELVAQERIIDELGTEMDSTKNRLDFVQKKVGMVMKKAGAKGQMMMICFLLVLKSALKTMFDFSTMIRFFAFSRRKRKMVLPLMKLGTLLVKTISKPLASQLKHQAKVHPRFRQSIINFAQRNHRVTTQIQRRIYGHATDVEIRPLNEEKAVQAAVDLIGELFIFAVLPFSQTSLVFIQSTLLLMLKVGGGVVIFEVQRSSRSEARKEEARKQELEELRIKDEELEKKMAHLQSKLAEVEELAKARGLTGIFKVKQQPGTATKTQNPDAKSSESSSS